MTPWEGVIQELRVSPNPDNAEDYCLESTEVIMIDGEKKSGPPLSVHHVGQVHRTQTILSTPCRTGTQYTNYSQYTM